MNHRIALTLVVGLTMIATSPLYGQSFLDRLEGVLGGQQSAPATEARVPGYLGVVADDTDRGEVMVLEVEPGSAAARAGIQKGDRILSVDGQSLKTLGAMAKVLEPLYAGDTVIVQYLREGKKQTAKVVLLAPPPQAPALERLERRIEEVPPPPEPEDTPEQGAYLGVKVTAINDALRERYQLALDKAVVVEVVAPGSPADRAGLPVGVAIVAIDGERIETAEQLANHLAVHRPGSEAELNYYRGRQLFRTRVRLAAAPNPEAPLRLGTDRQRLSEEPPPPGLPPEAGLAGERPAGNGPAFEGRRPAGRLLNQILEGVQQANQPPPPARANDRELERYVETLESYIDRLERRIVELETRLDRAER
jgi:predicted metalloprotease with PDZ domain